MPAHTDEPAWLTIARADLAAGVKEVPGKRGHPRIIEAYDAAGLAHDNDDVQSWCGCMMGLWLIDAGYPTPKNFYGAKQFETYGKRVEFDDWQVGDVGVFYRTPQRERDWKRHVGIIVGETKTHFKLLGGNQRVKGENVDGVTITTIAKKDCAAVRRPVKPTVKDLLAAGSDEMRIAGNIKKTGLAIGGVAGGGAAANEAAKAPDPTPAVSALPDLKETAEQLSLTQMVMEGAGAVANLFVAHPWLAGGLLATGGLWWLSRKVQAGALKRALLGEQITGAG